MSQIIFNSYIDLENSGATPSGFGYTVAYDIDGILKQKDQDGVITPVGQVSTQTLLQTLQYGNDSGIYSIKIGTASSILSTNGSGRLSMDYGGTNSVFISATLSNATASIHISNRSTKITNSYEEKISYVDISATTFSTYVGTPTFSTQTAQGGSYFGIIHDDTTIGVGGRIAVFETGKTYDGIGSENKAYVHINTQDSVTDSGVKNSVIIGGIGLTASISETVYLGNSVNINNAYTLPSTDGLANQVLKTDGGGTVSWSEITAYIPSLGQVLAAGNTSGTYSIIIGSGSSILSENGQSSIELDSGGLTNSILISTNGGALSESYILMGTYSTSIKAGAGSVTTDNLEGLVYTDDYSATFTSNSLVSKAYVDGLGTGTFNTYRTAYVDSAFGDNDTAALGRVDKPFMTVASASTTLVQSIGYGLVYIKKGEYTDIVSLKNNINFFCERDVVFTENGFTDFDGAVESNVYGNASFLGLDPSLVPLDIQNASTINFEFDRIDNQQVALKVNSSATVNFSGNYVKSLSDFGCVVSAEGSSTININVRERILGAYDVVYAKDGFYGNLIVNTPTIESNGDIGLSGVQADVVHALKVHANTTGIVNIKSDLINTSTTFGGGANSAAYIGSGTVSIAGKIDGGISPGIYLASSVQTGAVGVNGDILSQKESVVHLGPQSLKICNSLIKSAGLGTFTQSVYVGSADSKLYINNSTIYNSLNNSSLIYSSSLISTIGIYNSMGYSPAGGGNFVYALGTFSVGMHNVRSNKDNAEYVNDAFSPSGFIHDSGLYIPNF